MVIETFSSNPYKGLYRLSVTHWACSHIHNLTLTNTGFWTWWRKMGHKIYINLLLHDQTCFDILTLTALMKKWLCITLFLCLLQNRNNCEKWRFFKQTNDNSSAFNMTVKVKTVWFGYLLENMCFGAPTMIQLWSFEYTLLYSCIHSQTIRICLTWGQQSNTSVKTANIFRTSQVSVLFSSLKYSKKLRLISKTCWDEIVCRFMHTNKQKKKKKTLWC